MESIDSYTHRRIVESWRAAKKEADYTGRKKDELERIHGAGQGRKRGTVSAVPHRERER